MMYRHITAYIYCLMAFVCWGCQSSSEHSPSSTNHAESGELSPTVPWAKGPRFFQHGTSVLLYDNGRLWFDWDFVGREPAGTWSSAGMGDPLEVRRFFDDGTYSVIDRAPVQRQSTWRETLRLDLRYQADYAPQWQDLANGLTEVLGEPMLATQGHWRWEPRWHQAVSLKGTAGISKGSLHVYRRALPSAHASDLRLRTPVRVKHGEDILFYLDGKLWYQWQFSEMHSSRPAGLWLAYNPGALAETRRIDSAHVARNHQLPALSIAADRDPRPGAAWSISVSALQAKTLDALASALKVAKTPSMELRRVNQGVVIFEKKVAKPTTGPKQDIIAAAIRVSAPAKDLSTVNASAPRPSSAPDKGMSFTNEANEKVALSNTEPDDGPMQTGKAATASLLVKEQDREKKAAEQKAALAASRNSAQQAAQVAARGTLEQAHQLAKVTATAAKQDEYARKPHITRHDDPAQRQDVGKLKSHPSVFDPEPKKPAQALRPPTVTQPEAKSAPLKEPRFDAETVIKQTLAGEGSGQLEYQDTPVGKGKPSLKPPKAVEGPQRRYIRGYFGSGTLSYEIPLLGIKAHGMIKMFYDNGKPFSEINYHYGVRHGLSRYFYRSGEVRGMRYYRRGRPTGRGVTFFESGRLKPAPDGTP